MSVFAGRAPAISSTSKLALAIPSGVVQFGLLGDSIARNQFSYNVTNTARIGTAYVFTGRAFALWITQLLGRRAWLNVYACEGYSGYRSEQVFGAMLPPNYTVPIGAANDATIPYGVLSNAPKLCFEVSGTNNLGAGDSLQTMLQGRRAIWTRMLSNGILPVVVSLMPRSSPAINGGLVPTWNAALAAECVKWGLPFIDAYTPCANSDGTWKTGYTYINNADDPAGLHPGNEACQAIAAAGYAVLAPLLGLGQQTPTIFSSEAANHLNTTASGSQRVTAAAVNAGGSGYVVGDTITLQNSNLTTPQTPAVLTVATVSGSAVATVTVLQGGIYPAGSATSAIPQAGTGLLGSIAPGAGSGATFNLTFTAGLLDTTRKGDNFTSWDNGLFSATTGWTPRFDPNTSVVTTVAADALAEYGQALLWTQAAPGSSTNYADSIGPGTITVAAGQRWAYFGRFSFAAGSNKDFVSLGLQLGTTAGDYAWQFSNGGGAAGTAASTPAGASMPSRDFYHEIQIPVGITSMRPWMNPVTSPGSGAVTKLAQFGAQRLS